MRLSSWMLLDRKKKWKLRGTFRIILLLEAVIATAVDHPSHSCKWPCLWKAAINLTPLTLIFTPSLPSNFLAYLISPPTLWLFTEDVRYSLQYLSLSICSLPALLPLWLNRNYCGMRSSRKIHHCFQGISSHFFTTLVYFMKRCSSHTPSSCLEKTYLSRNCFRPFFVPNAVFIAPQTARERRENLLEIKWWHPYKCAWHGD